MCQFGDLIVGSRLGTGIEFEKFGEFFRISGPGSPKYLRDIKSEYRADDLHGVMTLIAE